MSRIADAMQKAREERPAPDGPQTPADKSGLSLRSITDVKVPWAVKDVPPVPAPSDSPQQILADGDVGGRRTPASAAATVDATAMAIADTSAPPQTSTATSVNAPPAGMAPPPRTAPLSRRGVSRPVEAPTAEALTMVRELFLSDKGRPIHQVLFTSVNDSRDSADVTIQIAAALAQLVSGPVYLLDLDLEHPTFDKRFGLEGQIGFSDGVTETGELRRYAHHASSPTALWIVPAGLQTATVRPMVGDARTQRRIAALIRTAGYVVAHTAAVGHSPDAGLVGRLFDGVVLVLQANTTTADATRRAANAVKASGAQLLGTVLDNRTASIIT